MTKDADRPEICGFCNEGIYERWHHGAAVEQEPCPYCDGTGIVKDEP